MMRLVLVVLDEGEAVMARIDVEEAGLERLVVIIADAEAENVAVEGDLRIDITRLHNDVAEAEIAGAKP